VEENADMGYQQTAR